jgi:putative heme-binding domain-containing protein
LNSRGQWKPALFTGLENGTISASDLSTSLVRSMVNSKDEFTRLRAAKVIGRFREPDADKGKIIADKRRLVLAGAADLAAGREVARRTCLTCHRLHGEGAEVGPDLTGVGRSSLDALLANIIDPNQIIGAGYENVEVETKDGRTVSGRLVENTDARVRLVAAGPKEDTIARSDIAHLRVLEMSVMPEGLEVMADADFRNMIWFLLAPPEEGPLTPEKRRALTGQDKPSAAVAPPRLRDAEAVALWNPEWRVVAPETETSPARLADVAGRQAVLRTHPFDGKRPARLKRRADLPAGRRALLRFAAAADRGGAWQVRVFVSTDPGKETLVHRALIEGGEKGHGDGGVQWQEFSIDLGRWAGSTVGLRVEQHAVDDRDAGGYWADLRVQSLDLAAER